MKKIMIVIFSFTLLIGCKAKDKEKSSIQLKPSEGEVVATSLDEVVAKINKKDSFVVIFSQTYCGSCMQFFMESDEYTVTFGLTLFDVSLDKESRSEIQNKEIIDQYFDAFSATPTIYYIEKGEVRDSLNAATEEVTLENYKNFLKKNNIEK